MGPKIFVGLTASGGYLGGMLIGLIIVIIGTLILLENLEILRGGFWEWFWPLLLIAVGLSIILKRSRKTT